MITVEGGDLGLFLFIYFLIYFTMSVYYLWKKKNKKLDAEPKYKGTSQCIRQKDPRDFPGGIAVGSPPANAGDTGSRSGPGGSHMPRAKQKTLVFHTRPIFPYLGPNYPEPHALQPQKVSLGQE